MDVSENGGAKFSDTKENLESWLWKTDENTASIDDLPINK